MTVWFQRIFPLAIIYEDEHVIVINKPAGLVVHPGAGNHAGTLVNALLAYYPPIREVGEVIGRVLSTVWIKTLRCDNFCQDR
jgi:23S rRNA-/tRNA-specific pseudouridylate synthase